MRVSGLGHKGLGFIDRSAAAFVRAEGVFGFGVYRAPNKHRSKDSDRDVPP